MKSRDSYPPLKEDESREFADEMREHDRRTRGFGPLLSGGDPDARWDEAESSGEETACGSATTPDQSVVEEIGEAVGITYQADEELRFGIKERARDLHRWELDPASAEDYREREMEITGAGPSEPILAMTHNGHRPHKLSR